MVDYWLRTELKVSDEQKQQRRTPVRITVTDGRGDTVTNEYGPSKQGFNRHVWNLRHQAPERLTFEKPQEEEEENPFRQAGGPRVAPGTYTVAVTVGGRTETRTVAVLANRGGSNPSGGVGSLPSPSPASSASPVASPTAAPTYGATTASNDGLSVPVPQGWAVANKDSEAIVLTDPNSEGSVTAASGRSSPTQTAQDNKNTIDAYFKQNYPDARTCGGTTATNGTFNGVHGVSWSLCFTLTAGGHSVAAASSLFAGANTSGSVYYIVMVVTRQDNLKAYVATAKPVLQGIHWKL